MIHDADTVMRYILMPYRYYIEGDQLLMLMLMPYLRC